MVKLTKYKDYATWVTFPVLAKFKVRVILTENLANSAGQRIGGCSLDGSADAACYNTKNGWSYMFLNPQADEGTIAHESWHIIFEIMDYVGAKIENEVVAYHLGYLINKIHTFKKEVSHAQKANDTRTKNGTRTKAATKGRTRTQ